MGEEITERSFSVEDFDRFRAHLDAEMSLLAKWFEGNKFCDDDFQCGLELEAWLIGQDGLPVPDNSLFLATLDRKSVVPELSKFNFELNVLPQYVAGQGLRDMQSELRSTWSRCEQVAASLDHRIMAIGILPTVTDTMLCPENMSPLKRYAALNEQVLRLRRGQPLQLEIEGLERLTSTHYDLMLESAATSIQVHLKVPQHQAVRYYNASLVASAFTVATAANAPLLFGKRLWHDTRIPLFEQAVDTAGPLPRVSFGTRYLRESLLELFQQTATHRVMLPVEIEQAPAKMPYVRMHNGTTWNWNRPLIGFEADGHPHLRIEHRPMSASPSMLDLFADVAFYLGLVHWLAGYDPRIETLLAFDDAKSNFYAAAKSGLKASVRWIDGRTYPIDTLIRETVLEPAVEAMHELGIAADSVRGFHEILSARIETGQNGAAWQLRKFSECDEDPRQLLLEYEANQRTSQPVHSWN